MGPSHQTSESNEEPPASKTPTTCQGLPPNLTVLPTVNPEYVEVAFLPTISSLRPGSHMRPCAILTKLRMRSTFGETPRTCTFAFVPVLIKGNGTTPTTSSVT